jgi:hypothetical protein
MGIGIDIRLSDMTALFVESSSYGMALTAKQTSTTIHSASAANLIFNVKRTRRLAMTRSNH